MSEHKEILTVEEAAEFLSLSLYDVREKAKHGHIPARKLGPGKKAQWRFSRRKLIEWIES